MAPNTQFTGKRGEDIACDFLVKKGYRILHRNFRTKKGEIDIIGELENTLVFFEVKSRKSSKYGYPKEYVSNLKKKRILHAACFYLTKKGFWSRPVRFDIIGIIFGQGEVKIEHEKDVIQISDPVDSSNSYWQPW